MTFTLMTDWVAITCCHKGCGWQFAIARDHYNYLRNHTDRWFYCPNGHEQHYDGPTDAEKVMPADDLEQLLHDLVEPWRGHYLTDLDVGNWKGYEPLVWDREPTVEEIARRLWDQLDAKVPGLVSIGVVESTEFDRCRTVRLTRTP